MNSHSGRPALYLFLTHLLVALSGCAGMTHKSLPNFSEPTTGMEFVFVNGGRFEMGDATGFWSENEIPVHEVKVEDFYAGKYEVTFAQYDRFCAATNRDKPADEGWGRESHPVINVTWDDASAFAAWLSEQGGHRFSLPSEAQWEYMARAGTSTLYWNGDSLVEGFANCADCGSRWDNRSTAPVGSFLPNPLGIHDTSGNVSEWCLDEVHRNYSGAPGNDRAWAGGDESRRILRGGSWSHPGGDLRSAYRDWDRKTSRRSSTGFRMVIGPPLPGLK